MVIRIQRIVAARRIGMLSSSSRRIWKVFGGKKMKTMTIWVEGTKLRKKIIWKVLLLKQKFFKMTKIKTKKRTSLLKRKSTTSKSQWMNSLKRRKIWNNPPPTKIRPKFLSKCMRLVWFYYWECAYREYT